MPHGATLEYLVSGEGHPTTAFAHGLTGGIADTRPLGSGVSGRKVFFQFREAVLGFIVFDYEIILAFPDNDPQEFLLHKFK